MFGLNIGKQLLRDWRKRYRGPNYIPEEVFEEYVLFLENCDKLINCDRCRYRTKCVKVFDFMVNHIKDKARLYKKKGEKECLIAR